MAEAAVSKKRGNAHLLKLEGVDKKACIRVLDSDAGFRYVELWYVIIRDEILVMEPTPCRA